MPKTFKPPQSSSDLTDNKELERVNDLNLRFEVLTLKLRECALHVPGNDLDKDFEIAELESQLLFLQEELLEKTTEIEIKTKSDFKQARDVWQLAKGLKFETNINFLDRLALSLFQFAEQRS